LKATWRTNRSFISSRLKCCEAVWGNTLSSMSVEIFSTAA